MDTHHPNSLCSGAGGERGVIVQAIEWDLLRTFEAVVRHGSFARRAGLRAVDLAAAGLEPAAIPGRDLWLVVHRSRHGLPRVRAVVDWLVEAFDAGGAPG